MLLTLLLSLTMMAGLFLLLWAAVGFIQNPRFFTSAPKAARDVIQPKPERFRGQHTLGWGMLLVALILIGGAMVCGAVDGIRRGFGFWRFFARFAAMLLLLKVYDIFFFDWFLLCRSGFFAHYFPEVRDVYGPELFGYNRKSHAAQAVGMVLGSLLLAGICARL